LKTVTSAAMQSKYTRCQTLAEDCASLIPIVDEYYGSEVATKVQEVILVADLMMGAYNDSVGILRAFDRPGRGSSQAVQTMAKRRLSTLGYRFDGQVNEQNEVVFVDAIETQLTEANGFIIDNVTPHLRFEAERPVAKMA